MGQTQCQHHLVLPQGDGVDDGGLYLLGHHGVIVLQKPDLRTHLQADGAGQLKVVELFLKALALVGQIACGLCVLRQAGSLCLVHRLLQLVGAEVGQLLLAREDIHAQLFEIGHVQLIHLVQHRNILEQLHLMLFEGGLDGLDVRFRFAVLGLHVVELVALFPEEAEDALFLFGGVKVLQLPDKVGDHAAHLAKVFGGHFGKCRLGEVTDLLLAGGAVLQHLLAVGDVDLLSEGVHHRLLLGAELDLFGLGGRSGFGLLFLGGRCFHRVEGQGGNSGCV